MISRAPQKNLRISCPECLQKLDASAVEAFTLISCPECGHNILVPRRFGQYLIEEPIGENHLAGVYRAVDIKLDRQVALKILDASLAEDADTVQAFLSAGRRMALLNHPHIIPIYSSGTQEKLPYVVMEFMAGGSVAELINRDQGSTPLSTCIRIAEQAARGLDAAARENTVHLGITPENLLLSTTGEVKIGDFGMSVIQQAATADDSRDDCPRVDVRYASPELLTGGAGDLRSDIYALGATLYHLLTGESPFPDNIERRLTELHAYPLATPRELRHDIDSAWSELVMSMLSPDPEHRPHGYKTLIRKLATYREQLPLPNQDTPTPAGAKGRRFIVSASPRAATLRTAQRIRRHNKWRQAMDAVILAGLVAVGAVLVSAARRQAPWYVENVQPLMQQIIDLFYRTAPAEPPEPATANGDVSVLQSVPAHMPSHAAQSPQVVSGLNQEMPQPPQSPNRAEPQVPAPPPAAPVTAGQPAAPSTELPQPPAAMESRPRPGDYDFIAAADALRNYLRQQPAATLAVEKARLIKMAEARPRLIMLMRRLPYEGEVSLRNGRILRGAIPICTEESITVKPERSRSRSHVVKWTEISFQQYMRFFEYYIEWRLGAGALQQTVRGKAQTEAGQDYFLMALLCDWYGYTDQARRYARAAVKQAPALRSEVEQMLYYLGEI